MKQFTSNNNDPTFNLALEEQLFRTADLHDPILLFYINHPSVIIGRYQNTIEEINTPFIEQNRIDVVRRISGGGAVYHDLGNLNFSVLSSADQPLFQQYESVTQPIRQALNSIGIDATLNGRNDIVIQDRKISGMAQYQMGNRRLCHGTLLFDCRLDNLVSALNVSTDKIESKGIKSIRSRVTNIKEHLKTDISIHELQQLIINEFEKASTLKTETLLNDVISQAEKLANEKYRTWEWNYGKSPPCNIEKSHRFPCGKIEAKLFIENGKITSIKCYGDFIPTTDISELENVLLNCQYDKRALQTRLNKISIGDFLTGLSTSELSEFLV